MWNIIEGAYGNEPKQIAKVRTLKEAKSFIENRKGAEVTTWKKRESYYQADDFAVEKA